MTTRARQEKRDQNHTAIARREDFRNLLLIWAQSNLRIFPWRINPTPYTILVAEVLLRRTTAAAVLRIYPSFTEKYPSLNKIANARVSDLASMLSSIGYHRQRAQILRNMARFIIERFNGKVPCSRDALLEIPHVGSYTAGAVLSLGCNQPSAMVDTNVERIYTRVFMSGLPRKGNRRFIDAIADMCVPKRSHKVYNLALLDLAALVCTYKTPKCPICPVSELCDYFSLGLPSR